MLTAALALARRAWAAVMDGLLASASSISASSCLSHFLFVSSLTRLNARSAGLVIALEPVYAIAFAWVLFSQQPTVRMMAGAALIVAAIVWSGLRKAPAAPESVPQKQP